MTSFREIENILHAGELLASEQIKLKKLLKEAVLYVPLSRAARGTDEQKVSVITIEEDGARYVPAFISEGHFFSSDYSKYETFSVVGEDLALVLPDSTGIIINPGRVESQKFDTLDFSESFVESHTQDDEIISQLVPLCLQFPEIRQAYLENINDGFVKYLCEISGKRFVGSSRFRFVREVAELSRNRFGFTGAIVVSDIPNPKDAKPFYIKSPTKDPQKKVAIAEEERAPRDTITVSVVPREEEEDGPPVNYVIKQFGRKVILQ